MTIGSDLDAKLGAIDDALEAQVTVDNAQAAVNSAQADVNAAVMARLDALEQGGVEPPPPPETGPTITTGPEVIGLTQTSATVRWTMSEVCSGQIEWGTTPALGNATAFQDISGGYSTHIQTIPGLVQGTTYYYRTVSTDADGITTRSDIAHFTTEAATTFPPPSGDAIGPRHDEYGAGPGGDFPPFPSGPDVVIAPRSIWQASDVGLALGQWVASQPNGKTLVFDSSGGGSAYGAGTEYVVDDMVYIAPGNGVIKAGQTFWMYNTRIRSTNRSAASNRTTSPRGSTILYFWNGNYENLKMLGGTLQGANALAGTFDCRTLGPETGHGIRLTSYQGLLIQDVYIRQVMGDGINLPQSDVTQARYGAYPYPSDAEIANVLIDGTGRQGVVPNQCFGFWMHHCHVKNVALSTFDAEDTIYGPNRYLRDATIEDNIFENWECNLRASGPNWHAWGLQLTTAAGEVDVRDNWILRRNRYVYGCVGWGNPDAELQVLGSIQNPNGPGNVRGGASPAPWHSLSETVRSTNFQFVDNVFDLEPNQRSGGWALYLRDWHGVIITGNEMHGLPVKLVDCDGVTFSDNGGSSQV